MITGRRRGPGARGGHGEVQGDRGQLQDMLVAGFVLVWPCGPSGGHVHGIAV